MLAGLEIRGFEGDSFKRVMAEWGEPVRSIQKGITARKDSEGEGTEEGATGCSELIHLLSVAKGGGCEAVVLLVSFL